MSSTTIYIVMSASGFRDVPYGEPIELEPAEVNAAIAEGFQFSLPHPVEFVMPAFTNSKPVGKPVDSD